MDGEMDFELQYQRKQALTEDFCLLLELAGRVCIYRKGTREKWKPSGNVQSMTAEFNSLYRMC